MNTTHQPCTFIMRIHRLSSPDLYFKCYEAADGNSFRIKNFKKTILGNAVIIIAGKSLDKKHEFLQKQQNLEIKSTFS